MLENQILREIKIDIRKNWCNPIDWDSLPVGNFNCFMYSVFNTIPTEIFESFNESGHIELHSLVNENVAFFGDIGQISGKVNYSNVPELVKALKSDLATLGIKARKCFSWQKVRKGSVKIAFYYNTDDLKKGKHSNFHFLRQENGKWMHKMGWNMGIEELEFPISNLYLVGLDLIGFFELSLKNNRF